MNNKGLFNHFKYRTKYWQERHKPLQNSSKSLNKTVITGTNISKPQMINSSPSRSSNSRKFIMQGQGQRSRIFSRTIENISSSNKWKLKKQLQELNNDNFNTIRAKQAGRYSHVKNSMDQRTYLGKNFLQKYGSKRPASMTLEIRPGSQHYRLQSRLSAVQRQHPTQFIPSHSARHRSNQSPLF